MTEEALKVLLIWELVAIPVVFVVGAFSHFLYHWRQNSLTAILSVASESVWEHEKLLFWPVFFYSWLEFFCIGRAFPNFWAGKAGAMLIAMIFMIVAYYGYKFFVKKHSLIGNVLLLLACDAVVQHFSNYFISHGWFLGIPWQFLGLPIMIFLVIILVIFTFRPPHLGLFQDKLHNSYGVHK